MPGSAVQEEELGSLLDDRHAQEGKDILVARIILIQRDIQNALSDHFQDDGNQRGKDAVPGKTDQ